VVVKASLAVTFLLATRLAGTTVCAAQVGGDEPLPDPIPSRVEIGGGAGLMVAYPEVAMMLSLPTGPRAALEVAVGWLPRVIYDVEHTLAQVQFRLPFRSHLRSRRSLLLGATRISARKRSPYDGGFWGSEATVVFAHAGVSLQWPIGRHADFRFDAQGLLTLDGELPLAPRATSAFVWHPGGWR
jgi:hypothetical protein